MQLSELAVGPSTVIRGFVYVRQPTNLGASANFNFLRRVTGSEYFVWVGSHDRVQPDFLRAHTDFLDRHTNYIVSYTHREWIDSAGSVVAHEPIKGFMDFRGGRWSRYLWSIESGEVCCVNGVMRRAFLPARTISLLPRLRSCLPLGSCVQGALQRIASASLSGTPIY